MNGITVMTTAQVMDSREIAQRTGKQHAHVCRDIVTMLRGLGEDESKFGSVYVGGNNERRRCFLLPKRECLILVSGYNVRLRAAIIDRWAELEAKLAPATPKTYAAALRAAADAAEALEAAEAAAAQAKQIAAAAQAKTQAVIAYAEPRVKFANRVAKTEDEHTLREAAKLLSVKPSWLVSRMVRDRILYRSNGRLMPYQQHLDNGSFRMRMHDNEYGTYAQPVLKRKGLIKVARKYDLELPVLLHHSNLP